MRAAPLLAGVVTAGVAIAGLPAAGAAQIAPPSGRAQARVPDAAEVCAACHGRRGEGTPARGVPRIAGLPRYYQARQLRSYANGTRRNPAMEAIARSLSARELNVVTAYFAQVEAPALPSASFTTAAGAAERGRRLATVGSRELQVQACENCHGPDGAGMPPNVPYLAGQDGNYLIATMNDWRRGTRRNDAGGQMAVIARALSAEAIADVARYYSSRSPPPPAPLDLVRPPPSPRRADSADGMGGGRADAPGVRVERAAADVRRLPAADLATADPARGRAILASGVHGCAACHRIPGVRGANGVVGPPLSGMARRGFIAGQLPNRPDVLVAFLRDPPSLVPGTGMPATGLSRDEARHVAAYLYTLER